MATGGSAHGARVTVELEIAKIRGELKNEIDRLLQQHSDRLMLAVKAAERRIVPLQMYLDAQQTASPAPARSSPSALDRLVEALLTSEGGLQRRALDKSIMANGLTIASARKARQFAEKQGLASRRGQVWSLTAAGRARALLDREHS